MDDSKKSPLSFLPFSQMISIVVTDGQWEKQEEGKDADGDLVYDDDINLTWGDVANLAVGKTLTYTKQNTGLRRGAAVSAEQLMKLRGGRERNLL